MYIPYPTADTGVVLTDAVLGVLAARPVTGAAASVADRGTVPWVVYHGIGTGSGNRGTGKTGAGVVLVGIGVGTQVVAGAGTQADDIGAH